MLSFKESFYSSDMCLLHLSKDTGFLLQGAGGRPPKRLLPPPKGVCPLKFSKNNRKKNRKIAYCFEKQWSVVFCPPPLNFFLAESQDIFHGPSDLSSQGNHRFLIFVFCWQDACPKSTKWQNQVNKKAIESTIY